MNLIKGKIVLSPEERNAALDTLEEEITCTLNNNALNADLIVNACDKLSETIGPQHVDLLIKSGISYERAAEYLSDAKAFLKKENLYKRLETELGKDTERSFVSESGVRVCEKIMPLGTLLHIAAGNQLGLPFYSAIEGLLTGNVNIVKLPGGDNGLSAMIFLELFKIEPVLKDYIYLFDYSSKDTATLEKLMDIADAVTVWGGDKTIEAVRNMADPTTKIIEWGHRLSFAYVTLEGASEESLCGLAENIIETNQLLCSSCQGIYVDTGSMDEIYWFCETFLPVLEQYRFDHYEDIPFVIQAQTGLMVYTEILQTSLRPCRVFQGKNTSLIAYEDSELETAIPYGNCWVKRLPREKLLTTIRLNKSHLQTAGLLCADKDKDELSDLLFKAGLTRVTPGKYMSKIHNGAAHDGEYSLRRYTRIVSRYDT